MCASNPRRCVDAQEKAAGGHAREATYDATGQYSDVRPQRPQMNRLMPYPWFYIAGALGKSQQAPERMSYDFTTYTHCCGAYDRRKGASWEWEVQWPGGGGDAFCLQAVSTYQSCPYNPNRPTHPRRCCIRTAKAGGAHVATYRPPWCSKGHTHAAAASALQKLEGPMLQPTGRLGAPKATRTPLLHPHCKSWRGPGCDQ
jgi:hypothetical protein